MSVDSLVGEVICKPDEILWGGDETEGMRSLGMSLRFAPGVEHCASLATLQPQTLKVTREREMDCAGGHVVCLHPVPTEEPANGMLSPIIAVGGRCVLQAGDIAKFRKDFELFELTKEWPGPEVSEQCPHCGARHVASDVKTYMLLWMPLFREGKATLCGGTQRIQKQLHMTIMPRLVCEPCFAAIAGKLSCEVLRGNETVALSVSELLPAVLAASLPGYDHDVCPGVTWLSTQWRELGLLDAFKAHFGQQMAERMGGKYNRTAGTGGQVEFNEKSAAGRTCDMCGARHRDGPTRLHRCTDCDQAFYCSRACQKAAWPDHRAFCKERQAKRERLREEIRQAELAKKREEAKLAEQLAQARLEAEAAARDSFLPAAAATPSRKKKSEGSKKKKGSKRK